MSRPITLRYGLTDVTAQPERHKAIREALAAIKTPGVKAFRAAQMRKTDKRQYPRFVEGMSTEEYVARYWRLNGKAMGLACEYNPRTGESVPFPEEVQRMLNTYEPLGTSPQYTPIFDGVEEPLV